MSLILTYSLIILLQGCDRLSKVGESLVAVADDELLVKNLANLLTSFYLLAANFTSLVFIGGSDY
jgi:hypothetical protein